MSEDILYRAKSSTDYYLEQVPAPTVSECNSLLQPCFTEVAQTRTRTLIWITYLMFSILFQWLFCSAPCEFPYGYLLLTS